MTDPRTASEQRARSLALAENATLWTLLATVSLFTAGQISNFYLYEGLGVRALRLEAPWQDRVFEGGIAILNMALKALFEPSLAQLPWLVALAVFGLCLWRRSRLSGRPRQRMAVTAVAACAYAAALVLLSMSWGRLLAELVRGSRTRPDHFVFAPDAAARLPPALLRDNEQRALRLIVTTPDFFVVLSGDAKTVYRIATRDVDLQETSQIPPPQASPAR